MFSRFRTPLIATALVGCLVAAAAPPALAAEPSPGLAPLLDPGSRAVPGRYVVVVTPAAADDPVRRSALERTVVGKDGRIIRRYANVLDGFAAELPAAALDAVRADPSVAYVEPVTTISAGPVRSVPVRTKAPGRPSAETVQPNPPAWGIDRIDQRNLPLNNAYDYDTTGTGVTAYTLDSGVRPTHTEFGGRASNVINFHPDGGTTDCHGHGTNVASILGGAQYGVAKQVTIRAIRVLDCFNSGTNDSLIAAMDWLAVNHGPRSIANFSLQGYSTTVNTSLERLIDSGVFAVTIANNFNTDACTNSPRSTRGVVVGATESDDRRWADSSWGTCVDVFAPGAGINGAYHTSDTAVATFWGTSMAAPHVVGWIARYLERNPTATQAQVKTAIIDSSTKNVVIDAGTGSPNRLLYANPITPGGGDTIAPSAPGRPTASGVTATSATLAWAASTDNVGVTGYDVYAGSGTSPVATSTGTSVTVTGLTPQTTYTFSVRARDAAGNTSAASPTATVTTQPSPTSTCRVTYRVVGQSSNAFTANVTIANTGTTTIDGWQLRWTFTAGQRVTYGWSATYSQPATQVTATNLSWNRTISPGGSVQIGFNGSWSGSNPAPTSFTVNNAPCTTA